jgi:hypothetical protein
MVDYNGILTDPTNPISIIGDRVLFPKWLTEKMILKSQIVPRKNMSLEDEIILKHASYYDAIIWYNHVIEYSPDSVFLELTDEEANLIIKEWRFDRKEEIVRLLETYNFIKTSTKSSHSGKKILTFDDFMEELTHPNLIMSFKKGCRHLFFRKYIETILAEYRIYFYGNKIKYIEEYVSKDNLLLTKEIIEFVKKVNESVPYEDYLLDVCRTPDGYLVIEINTPLYLFGGIHLIKYEYYLSKIHYGNAIFACKRNGEVIFMNI